MNSPAEAPIVMPKLGLTMLEGVLSEWRVRAGDEVETGQILFVVETDKIANEVEAPASGRIVRLLAAEGDTIEVGAPIALWTGPSQGAANGGAKANAPPTEDKRAPQSVEAGVRILSTPVARRMASMAQIPLGSLRGTGPNGRIQARDVQAAQEFRANAPEAKPATREQGLRRVIAERLLRSKREIPHFYLGAEARMDALVALRRDLAKDAPKLTVTAFLAAAVARALAAQPEMNVVWREGAAAALPSVRIGIAVDTPRGVMAPVIAEANALSLGDLAEAIAVAAERARSGRLRANDAGQAAISVSNVGMFAVRALTPVIDPDQTYILGVGAPQHVFRPDALGAPIAVHEATLTLACDHRVVDGAPAARLLAAIVDLLETPARLLIAPRPSEG